MKERRHNRLADEMRDLVAKFLETQSDRSALVTVTRTELLEEGKTVKIYISVFPAEKEEVALGFANRKLGELRTFVATETKMKYVPVFHFVIDTGEKNRQRIDELLR